MPKEKALQGSIQEKNRKYYAVIGYNDVITSKRKMKWIGLGLDTSGRKADISKAFREAVRKFEQEYRRMCEGMSSPDEYPLVAFLNDWLDKVKIRSVQKSTFHGYKSLVNGKIARFFGDKFTLGDLNIRTVTVFMKHSVRKTAVNPRFSAVTIFCARRANTRYGRKFWTAIPWTRPIARSRKSTAAIIIRPCACRRSSP